jgi:hypothetical protein
MVFNGHTPESVNAINEETFAQIQTMYADGVLGNQKTINLLGLLVTGIFNYLKAPSSSAYELKNVIGRSHDYIFPPMPEEEKKLSVNSNLLAFMSQAPGFDSNLFGVKNGSK